MSCRANHTNTSNATKVIRLSQSFHCIDYSIIAA
jgi:hypothetical protein